MTDWNTEEALFLRDQKQMKKNKQTSFNFFQLASMVISMQKMRSCQSDPVVKFNSRSSVLFTLYSTQFSYLSSHNNFLCKAVGGLVSSHSQAMLS